MLNRTSKVIRNSFYSSVSQIVLIVSKFITQTFFIRYLGVEYLGVNGLFVNILSVVSFAELGIGSAIVYSIYKPLAESDSKKISAFINYYKKAYEMIALVIFLIGMGIIPFLDSFVKGDTVNHFYQIYIVYLLNSVFSYLFTYKRSLLIADQQDYLNSINITVFTVIQNILQIAILFFFRDMLLYSFVMVICTIISNIVISKKVDRMYPFLRKYKRMSISKFEKKKILSNTTELVGSKIGGIVLNGTDNIIVSSFVGLVTVGYLSNYNMIITSINSILQKISWSTTASLGNLAVEDDKEKSQDIFEKHLFINLLFALFCSSLLMTLISPFITFWLGEKYTLSFVVVILLVMNFSILQIRNTNNAFINAFGTFNQLGLKSIIEALTNLFLSLLFVIVFNLGVEGVFLGTLITNLSVSLWWEIKLVFQQGIKRKFMNIIIKEYSYVAFISIVSILSSLFINSYIISNTFLSLVYRGLICLFILLIIIFILFRKNKNMIYLFELLKRLIKH